MSSQWFDQERLEHPVSPAYPAIALPSFPCRPGSSILIDCHIERSLAEKQAGRLKSRVTIGMLPDVALLEIFDFYVDGYGAETEGWHTLVHVCRKWRNVVFGSPRRLKLRLACTASTPVRETIDAWPPLPILVTSFKHWTWGVDNIIAALEHNDRICEVIFDDIPSPEMEKLFAAMQQPFPALENLYLCTESETDVVPASFLGGSAPQLQKLWLNSIPFPGLPKLLLSATHLVSLHLSFLPPSGYFSPEAMVTGLSALASLKRLDIGFEPPRSRPDRKRLSPRLTRTLLPALTYFRFKGVSEYLDDLVARIDAPLLGDLDITFFHQLIFDDTPQLTQFISRTPNFGACDDARVQFSDWDVQVSAIDKALKLKISCKRSDWQISSLAQVCGSIFIPAIKHLYIEDLIFTQSSQDDIETVQWLELLNRLTAVKDLRMSWAFTPRIAPTLQELVGGRVTEVLPALQTLFLEEALPPGVQKMIDKFVAARELAGHPISVSHW